MIVATDLQEIHATTTSLPRKWDGMGWDGVRWHGLAWHSLCSQYLSVFASCHRRCQSGPWVRVLRLPLQPGFPTSCSRSNLLLYHNRPRGISDPHLWLSSRDLLSPRSLVNLVIL